MKDGYLSRISNEKEQKMPMYNKRKIYYSDMTKGLEAIESRVLCNNRFH